MNSVSKSIEPNKKNYHSQYPYIVKGNLTLKFQIHDIKFLLTNKAKTIRYWNIVIMKTSTSRICQKKGILTHEYIHKLTIAPGLLLCRWNIGKSRKDCNLEVLGYDVRAVAGGHLVDNMEKILLVPAGTTTFPL